MQKIHKPARAALYVEDLQQNITPAVPKQKDLPPKQVTSSAFYLPSRAWGVGIRDGQYTKFHCNNHNYYTVQLTQGCNANKDKPPKKHDMKLTVYHIKYYKSTCTALIHQHHQYYPCNRSCQQFWCT